MQISSVHFTQPAVLEKNRAAIRKVMAHTFDAGCCERLADAFFESVNTDDEPYDKIGRALMQTYVSCSDEQASAVDLVLVAMCGWSMNSLLKKAELIEDDDCMFHDVPTPPRYDAADQDEAWEGRESNG